MSFSGNRNYLNCYAHPLIEDYRVGNITCTECGLAVVDAPSEWHTFNNEYGRVDSSRGGGQENLQFSGSGSSTGTRSASSDDVGSPNKSHNEISYIADRINLPKTIVDRANNLLEQVRAEQKLIWRSNNARAAACLYIACRQDGVPRTFKEICAASKMSGKLIFRYFKSALKSLKTRVDLITTADFISRFCANLGLPNMVERAATHIADEAKKRDILTGKSPLSVAAAAIYMASQASGEKRCQRQIGNIVGVHKKTISGSYKLIYPHAARLFPDDFEFTTPTDQLPRY